MELFRHFALIPKSEDELEAALFPETGCASGPNDSCGSVVEDELFPELCGLPWNDKRYEIVCYADNMFLFLVNRGS